MENPLKTIEDCGAVTENLHLMGKHVAGRDIHITVNSQPIVVVDLIRHWINGISYLLGKLTPFAGGLLIATAIIALGWLDCESAGGPYLMRLALSVLPFGLFLLWKPSRWKWPMLMALVGGLLAWELNPMAFLSAGCQSPVNANVASVLLASTSALDQQPSEELILETVDQRVKSWQKQVAATMPFDERQACSSDTLRHYLAHCGLPQNGQGVNYYFTNNEVVLRSKWNLERLGLQLNLEKQLSNSDDFESQYFQRIADPNLTSEWNCGIFRSGPVKHSLRASRAVDSETWEVVVEYEQPERLMLCKLSYSEPAKMGALTSIRILGFQPMETFQFSRKAGAWNYIGIK